MPTLIATLVASTARLGAIVLLLTLAASSAGLSGRAGAATRGPATRGFAERVDTALVLAVDVSNSVTPERYRLQMDGIAKAFIDPDVQSVILSGPHGAMLVTLVEWSNKGEVIVPWTLVTDALALLTFADKVHRAPRNQNDFTCMADSLRLIETQVLPRLPVPADRMIIDVSGDGHDNCNPEESVDRVRDRLVAAGVTINGLPILEGDEADTLEQWYAEHVIGGRGAFLVPAHGFDDFQRAMRQKFLVEISGGATHGGLRSVRGR